MADDMPAILADMDRLGLLRDVTIVRCEEVEDGAGGTIPRDVPAGTVRARVRGLSGSERLALGREVSIGYRKGFLAANPDVVTGCRLIDGTETLDVTHAWTEPAVGLTFFEAESVSGGAA